MKPLLPVLLALCVPLVAQEPTGGNPPQQPRKAWGPIVLKSDDVPAFPAPPADWDKVRPDMARGRLEKVEYDSKTVGIRRKVNIYTRPTVR